MKKLIILSGAGLLLLLLALAAVQSAAARLRGPSWAELELERLAVERAEAVAPAQTLAAQALALAPAVAVYVLIALGAVGGALLLARFRHERQPDGRGLLPVRVAELPQAGPAALASFHLARVEDARRPAVPAHLTYSPHTNYRGDGAPGRAAAPAAAQLAAPAGVPTFAQLLDSGRVGRGNPLLLGFDRDTGAEIVGSWLDLYSCAVGGLSGSGKSWTATFLAAQAALYGSRLLILDPHAESDESLAGRLAPMRRHFLCAPAATPAELLAAVELAEGELERRKAGGYVRGSAPIVILADEFSALQRGALAEPLARLVEGLAQEGRKLDLFGLICGQVWTASRAGGTELRDSLASAYVHRLRPAQARVLTGYPAAELPGDLLELPPGHAYMLATSGELRPVIIPEMTPADVARVAELLDGRPVEAPPAAPSPGRPVGFRPGGAGAGASAGAAGAPLRRQQDAPQLTPEEAAIVAAFVGGKSPSDLAAELADGKKSGDAYKQAARRVADVLRRALGARAAAGA